MNNKMQFKVKLFAFVIALFLILGFGVAANEAKKEVYFLCESFSEGDTYAGVLSQLETVDWSHYKVESQGGGKRIEFSSPLNFHFFSCTINFNLKGLVVSTQYD